MAFEGNEQLARNIMNSKSFIGDNCSKMKFSEVFIPRNGYINELHLYMAHFNAIPNLISEPKINCRKATVWFKDNYANEIKEIYFIKRQIETNGPSELDDIFYIMDEDLMVDFDTNNDKVRLLFRNTENPKIEKILNELKRFVIRKRYANTKPKISILTMGQNGFKMKSMDITRPKLKIEDNYNHDFQLAHQEIYKRLNKKNDKGLVLLHGKPGTGKTSYIRYLIATLKKEVIFLPPNMASAITSPDLINVLIDNPNSIFVIEDAENIVIDREKNGQSPVSALLNISDGLLSDCLNIQIICSFNTDISKVDRALLRKGRLIAKYEFKELEVEKAQQLSNKLGFSTDIQTPMTLTDIYNQNEEVFHIEKKIQRIGFGI